MAHRFASPEAGHAADLAERDERISMPEADRAALDGDSKRPAASGRHRNSSRPPPRSGTWTAEYRRKRAIEARYARQAEWRPPGGIMEHPGATRKLITNRPGERRRPAKCGACHGTNLSERHAFARQVADF